MSLSGAKEASEVRVGSASRVGCESGVSGAGLCGCQLCILGSRLSTAAAWLLRTGDASKKRFLTGLLLRCQSLDILRNVGRLLQVTLGKDFTYARSRQRLGVPGHPAPRNSEGSPDSEEVIDTWNWFSCSPCWMKANYVLGVMALCDVSLLHDLGSLIQEVQARERQAFLHNNVSLDDLESDAASIQESYYSFYSDEHPELDLLVSASSSYGPLEDAWDLQQEVDLNRDSTGTDALMEISQPITEDWGCEVSKEDCPYSEDPSLMVVLGAPELLSGISHHVDFVRRLPVHLAKRILGLLDKSSLCSCLSVSKHWCYLAEEVKVDTVAKRMLENRAMIMQGSSCLGPNPIYAKIREVLVPITEDDKNLRLGERVTKPERDSAFKSIYAGVKTRALQMEERNVYCGTFSVTVLSEQEDPLRVAHYCGGHLVATGSRDRVVRLLDVATAEPVPPTISGHAGSIRAVLLCEEHGFVLSAGYDLSIRCWSLQTGQCVKVFCGHMGTINCLDLQGEVLVSGAKDCKVKVWNLLTGKCYEKMRFKHDSPILCVKVDKCLVLSSCEQGLVKMWSVKTANLVRVMDAHQGPVSCLFFDQWHVLSGGADGLVLAWSTNCEFKGSLLTFQHPEAVLTLAFHFLRVITGCADGKIRILNFLTGECLRVIRAPGQQSPVRSLHPHKNKIVVNTSTSILLFQFNKLRWDYYTLECVALQKSPALHRRSLVAPSCNTIARASSEAASRAAPPPALLSHHVQAAKKWCITMKWVESHSERPVWDLVLPTANGQRPNLHRHHTEFGAAMRDTWKAPPSATGKDAVTKPLLPQRLHSPTPPAGTRSSAVPPPRNLTPRDGSRTHTSILSTKSLQSNAPHSNVARKPLARRYAGGVVGKCCSGQAGNGAPQWVGGFTTSAKMYDMSCVFLRAEGRWPAPQVGFKLPERPRKPSQLQSCLLDPFRWNTTFQLPTATQLEKQEGIRVQEALRKECRVAQQRQARHMRVKVHTPELHHDT